MFDSKIKECRSHNEKTCLIKLGHVTKYRNKALQVCIIQAVKRWIKIRTYTTWSLYMYCIYQLSTKGHQVKYCPKQGHNTILGVPWSVLHPHFCAYWFLLQVSHCFYLKTFLEKEIIYANKTLQVLRKRPCRKKCIEFIVHTKEATWSTKFSSYSALYNHK